MATAAIQARIVAEARKWLGTPYHHAADVLGAGCDCAMLLVRVYHAAGLIPDIDPRPYPRDWHLHRDEERYLGWIEQYCHSVDGEPQPGDVVVYRVGRCFSHGAIVTDWPMVIHAYMDEGAVVIGRYDSGRLAGRAWQAWRINEVSQ